MNEETGSELEPAPLKGKALLDALFLRAAIGNIRIFNRKHGKHHVARSQRAQARIGARQRKRRGA
jgi:hypothetical protein